MNAEEIPQQDLEACARSPYFFMVGIVMSRRTDLFPSGKSIKEFDHNIRATIEAFVIHSWFADYWVSILYHDRQGA